MIAALTWLAIVVPLVGAAVARVTAHRAAVLTAVMAVVAAAPPATLLIAAAGGTTATSTFAWLPDPGLRIGVRLDPLAAVMSATVAFVGVAVVVFATGYFARDQRRASALAGLLAFLAAMQGLVLADGYLALLICWELVGAASARLIAYSRDDPSAAPGAVRAFLTTRAADVGFYVAVLALFTATGSVAFGQGRPDGTLGVLVGAGLVLAAAGKSAQAPLQTWLMGAMAGPTPVSALLHSATMVAAGVYLLVRSMSLLAGWPLELAGWIGGMTAVAGAAMALAQDDLKRVLAASTASQLGLMFVGAAAGGPAVAVFHLVTHAAGKAGLFLAAGVFQQARRSVALRDLAGAGREEKAAFAGFVVCALSIAAVPPFAGFWSKEHIAAAADGRAAWFALVLLASAGSAAYLLRPTLVLGSRGPLAARLRAGRPAMLAGVALVAVGATVGGLLGSPIQRLLGAPPLPTSTLSLALSVLAVAAGTLGALRRPPVPDALRRSAARQFDTGALQRALVQRPVMALVAAAAAVERALDWAVDAVGSAGLAAARRAERLERDRLDGVVDGLAAAVGQGGVRLRRLQSGRLYEYLRDALIGAAALALIVVLASLS